MSMRFAMEQLNPAMRRQAEAKLRAMTTKHPARAVQEGRETQIKPQAHASKPEQEWLWQLRAAGMPEPQTEYCFSTSRKWRFDTAWPELKIAFEVEGGLWIKGGGAHSRPENIERDIEKYNAAQLDGWRVYRVTTTMVKDGRGLALAEQVLGGLRCWP